MTTLCVRAVDLGLIQLGADQIQVPLPYLTTRMKAAVDKFVRTGCASRPPSQRLSGLHMGFVHRSDGPSTSGHIPVVGWNRVFRNEDCAFKGTGV